MWKRSLKRYWKPSLQHGGKRVCCSLCLRTLKCVFHSESHLPIRRRKRRRRKKQWERVSFSLYWHLNQVHSHTHRLTEYLAVRGDSACLWAEHLSHPQATTEPIILSSIHPCTPPSSLLHLSIRFRITLLLQMILSDLCRFSHVRSAVCCQRKNNVLFSSKQTNKQTWVT